MFRSQDKEFLKQHYDRYVQPLVDGGASVDVTNNAWEKVCQKTLCFDLRTELYGCHRCKLRDADQLPSWGLGNIYSPVLMIIEGRPPHNPDALALLDQVLESVNIVRGFQYTTYAVKCSSVGKMDKNAIQECSYYLEREIQVVKPQVILCMGSTSSSVLCSVLQCETSIRGTWANHSDISVLFAHQVEDIINIGLQNENAMAQLKRELWHDMLGLVKRFPQVQGAGHFGEENAESPNEMRFSA